MELNVLTGEIVGAAIEVHRELGGPGLLEEIYEAAMVCELGLRGLDVKRQIAVPVLYKGYNVKKQHYLDLLVEGRVVVEVKAVEKHAKLFESQLLTYLRLTQLKVGLLINFGETQLRHGVRRVVNGLSPSEDLCASAPPR
jgi:GxxExxY protein